ncbi:glutaminase, partial [Mobiluncus curtisii]|nr:glutaminase [Mobiluncus curtisii]
EAAGAASANQIPQLPYGDNPGIAALLANAQNMLNADGSQHQDPPFTPSAAADTPEFPAVEVPDAMRADFDTPLAPGEPASPPTSTTPPARTTSPTGRKPTQRRPEPVHS